MAQQFYVTIEGTKQGKFKGESQHAKAPDKITGLAFHYELTAPRDAATGLASGKRQHSPVTFVKEWGASSPQLFQAAVENELLKSILFEFVETTPEGMEKVFHTVKLTNASIASIKQDVQGPPPGVAGETHDLEEISFTFQQIEMESIDGKTAAADKWMASSKLTRVASSGLETGQERVTAPIAAATEAATLGRATGLIAARSPNA
jgi:type VI secretion system secreted protein Hcp